MVGLAVGGEGGAEGGGRGMRGAEGVGQAADGSIPGEEAQIEALRATGIGGMDEAPAGEMQRVTGYSGIKIGLQGRKSLGPAKGGQSIGPWAHGGRRWVWRRDGTWDIG